MAGNETKPLLVVGDKRSSRPLRRTSTPGIGGLARFQDSVGSCGAAMKNALEGQGFSNRADLR